QRLMQVVDRLFELAGAVVGQSPGVEIVRRALELNGAFGNLDELRGGLRRGRAQSTNTGDKTRQSRICGVSKLGHDGGTTLPGSVRRIRQEKCGGEAG